MRRLAFATISLLTVAVATSNPAFALEQQPVQSNQATANKLDERFDKERQSTLNSKLNSRFDKERESTLDSKLSDRFGKERQDTLDNKLNDRFGKERQDTLDTH
jgi:hypothetical protein